MGEFLTRGWELILPVCGGTSALDPWATLTVRRLHEPRTISNHPVGLGSPHTPRHYRPGKCAFSSTGFLSCRDIEGHLNRGRELIFFGCGGTLASPRGATLAARWLHEPQQIGNHPVELGFPHTAGRHRPRGSAFSSPGSWSCKDMGEFFIEG